MTKVTWKRKGLFVLQGLGHSSSSGAKAELKAGIRRPELAEATKEPEAAAH